MVAAAAAGGNADRVAQTAIGAQIFTSITFHINVDCKKPVPCSKTDVGRRMLLERRNNFCFIGGCFALPPGINRMFAATSAVSSLFASTMSFFVYSMQHNNAKAIFRIIYG